mmetsp:Transcript_5990/g.7373  ORF Transcript_5990/g.7373 Transcript_5990/m.7373 type:complete len:103 (+) Transcript_5990:100-408(+)
MPATDEAKEELPPIQILHKEMGEEMEAFSLKTVQTAYISLMKGEKVHMKDVAEMVKLAFDDKYPGAWHVIVGKSFGSFVTHEVSSIIYFFVGSVGFLIFKHG